MEISPLRHEINHFIEYWINKIDNVQDILEIGIAGDEKPGGNYKYFADKNYKTLDIDPQFKPDYVVDICDTQLQADIFDLIILSQTLEHIWDFKKAIAECYRLLKKGGYLIVDSPWNFPYHPEYKYDDYWRFSAVCLKKLLNKFEKVETLQGKYCFSALGRK